MSKWYESAVFYHIYPLGLCGCPKENDGVTMESHFDKLEEWVSHICGIGCTAIYIGPLFESASHGYDTTDYKMVDRRIGTNEEFRHFVKKCHEDGIRVIVDGVFNHTGRRFFAFEDIKNNRENSQYKDWYCNVNLGGNNEFNDGFSYESWQGHNILPKLNQKNPAVKDYICEVIRYWVEEFDIDGIRLDAADVLDFDFMKQMRQTANEVKEDFWLMGEVIHGDYSRWANPQMLHSVTNYELHKALFSGHNDHNYFEIAHNVKRILDICKGIKLYTFADNHDVPRLYNKLKEKEHAYLVYLLDYTLPGIPSIYYGSEFLIEGDKKNGSDDGIRPCLDLADYMEGADYKEEYKKLIDWIRFLAELKGEYKELSDGIYEELLLTNRQYAYSRKLENSAVITAANNDEKEAAVKIPVRIKAEKAIDLFTGEELAVENGAISLDMEANSGTVLYVSQRENL